MLMMRIQQFVEFANAAAFFLGGSLDPTFRRQISRNRIDPLSRMNIQLLADAIVTNRACADGQISDYHFLLRHVNIAFAFQIQYTVAEC